MSSTRMESDYRLRYPLGSDREKRHIEEVRRWKKRHPDKVRALGRLNYARNKEKFRSRAKANYRKKPEIWLRSDLKRRYDMSVEEFATLLESQNGVCAICGKPERGKNNRLSVDHDHESGAIRGLLCNACNAGLGRFNDNLALLQKAVSYLINQMRAKDGAPTDNQTC